ncbi:divalent metal cation transporter [Stratiformator vulcanicus]|uniref:Natural resistance-associated macrophage protein n=1 Tax=Stratiformator vulcanicus TaxID=2527980 RepID=A0A517R030_9PLAN|nr:divalent metal cation transporter [Stratiformator vulcanicus]QDT37257.1 Natural resistance-associated macrophage protein [Stratiformator vulcanicus]
MSDSTASGNPDSDTPDLPQMSASVADGPEAPADDLALERNYLAELEGKSWPVKLGGYIKLSGPGWLQSALTLGGGSLATGMYLGVLGGYGMLWLQPLAMILGIIMLSAIGYVTLTTGQRPFGLINRHVNPVLGWSWLIASLMANMVWALPQYALANGVMKQNLLPSLLGNESTLGSTEVMGLNAATVVIVAFILLIVVAITWSYGSGHWGVRVYEWMLKITVGLIVACFIGVVVRISLVGDGLPWGEIFAGFVPNLGTMFRPAAGFGPILEGLRNVDAEAATYWAAQIEQQQRDVLMGAFATAVGINMTFLLPYSMLGRGWRKEHRGLAIFDLSTGMFIPFLLATSCVVIASASQFHLKADTGASASPEVVNGLIEGRIKATGGEIADASTEERKLASMLVKRDVGGLSEALTPLLGRGTADIVFGFGVLAMALSTITLLMLVSGFVICELMNVPASGWPMRIGSLAACTGVLGPFIWGEAQAWLAVPTSVFGLVLLPIAYVTFLALMNSKAVLGDQRPTGGKRVLVNTLMLLSTVAALFGSGWAVVGKLGLPASIGLLVVVVILLIAGEVFRRTRSLTTDGDA